METGYFIHIIKGYHTGKENSKPPKRKEVYCLLYILFPGGGDALIHSRSGAAIPMPLCDALAISTPIAVHKTFQNLIRRLSSG